MALPALSLPLILFIALSAAAAPLDAFLAPIADTYAANSDIVNVTQTPDAATCAAACLLNPLCVSFNYCGTSCGLSGFSMAYRPAAGPCALYTRIRPRNDTHILQAVPWAATSPPPMSVTLGAAGLLGAAYVEHHDTYLAVRSPLDMLFFFYDRAKKPAPNGSFCFGWDDWIKSSAAGNFLMGAGSYLQWATDAQLQQNVQLVVDGIVELQEPDGWIMAFNETDIDADNLPDYCSSWLARGLLDAHRSGTRGALAIARQHISLFNNHSRLAWFLPQNGGPAPVQPYPSGFNNATNGGYGTANGHMIYIEYQGMIKHSLMALTEAGTQADIDILEELYVEDWWLRALLAGDEYHAIWHRQFFSHNYEVTAYEAFLDIYVLTGNTTYLAAVMSAWSMLRAHWILPGGSFALNEGNYYPPDSYYIGFTGTNVASAHDHSAHVHVNNASDPYYHAPCMAGPGVANESPLEVLRADAKQPSPPLGGPNDSDPPTGELCGNVFWAKLNQRLHHLEPDNEAYVAEIERSIINVGLAALGRPGSGGQGPNGTGIRYFANQHKAKQNPSMHASCCEGQGTRLFGSLPEFVFSIVGSAADTQKISVDLFTEAVLSFQIVGTAASLAIDTRWPYAAAVALTLTLPAASSSLDVAVRMPAWLPGAVSVVVNGAAWPAAGVPGSYLHLTPAAGWPLGASTIAFDLAMRFQAIQYTGHSQLPPYARWAYLVGPVLLSLEGPWDSASDSLVMPSGLDPANPAQWLQTDPDNPLHFGVPGFDEYSAKPYFEVQEAGERFSNYPCFSM